MVANILPADIPNHPTPTLRMGSIGQSQFLQKMIVLHKKLMGIMKCSDIVAIILTADPLPHDPRGWGQKVKSTFSEHGHVAYKIKGNHEMQQHGSKYFAHRPPCPPTTLGDGVKIQLYGTWSCCISNLRNRECSHIVANILAADIPTPPPPDHESIGQKSSFTEHGHVAFQTKGNQECSHMVAHILPTDPTKPPSTETGDGIKNSKFNFFQNMFLLHIKLKGITDAATC